MEKRYAILNTDEVNRYNQKFTITSLNLALRDNYQIGVPQCLSHDRLRPAGWVIPTGLYFEPGSCFLLGSCFLPINEREQKEIVRLHEVAISRQHTEMCEPHIEELKEKLNTEKLDQVIYASCVANIKNNIAKESFPKLFEKTDKDGLIPLQFLLDKFKYLGQGIFKDKSSGLAIFAHPAFRKSQSRYNNFNFFFLDQLIGLFDRDNLEIKLRIDPDLVGDADTFIESHELEYWWGPKFDDDIEKIPNGVTHHEASKTERLYSLISRTEFYWKTDNDERVLEIEELKDAALKDQKYHNRYIHSIFNSDENFRHFDGAIRAYDESQMINRLDIDLKKASRNTKYTKLFRIDGDLDVDTWKTLIHHYFQGNHQIGEYFGIENEVLKTETSSKTSNASVLERLVPYKIDAGDGPRIMWSFHSDNIDKTKINKRFISSHDLLTISSGTIKIIESDVHEIIKALERNGATIELPEDTIFASCEDMYWNIPSISHYFKKNLEDRIDETIKAFSLILESLKNNSREKIISFTIGWSSDLETETRLSVFGHSNDILEWIKNNYPFPLKKEKENAWLEKQATWLENNYPINKLQPPVFEIINDDGVIYIKRTPIASEFDYTFVKENKQTKILFKFEPDQFDIADEFEQGNILVANGFIIKDSECSKCKKSYFNCSHSKSLDKGVYQKVTDAQLYGLVWTDKRA